MYRNKPANERGQSLVELALFVPILILLLIGLAEIGVLASAYIDTLDGSRASARYVSPLDPALTRCQTFSASSTGRSVSFTSDCMIDGREYPSRAATVKSWGMKGNNGIYKTCQGSPTINFFYVAGCMALLNMPEGYVEPANGYDDIIVTTLPITGGAVASGAITWSFFGNQPISTSNSIVVNITNPSNNSFTIQPGFATNIQQYATAPSTGLVVVEVYHAHPQLTKLFNVTSQLAGSKALIPDPIPLHTHTVFPLPAVEPE